MTVRHQPPSSVSIEVQKLSLRDVFGSVSRLSIGSATVLFTTITALLGAVYQSGFTKGRSLQSLSGTGRSTTEVRAFHSSQRMLGPEKARSEATNRFVAAIAFKSAGIEASK